MDFSVKKYVDLLQALENQNFSFSKFIDYSNLKVNNTVIIREDVDILPQNSLAFAKIQSELEIKSTFYFRMVPESFNEQIIWEIDKLGHEIGYHYEDVGSMAQRLNGITAQRRKGSMAQHGESFEKELVDMAIDSFSQNLEKLRKIVPVKTICMHGSPMNRWDSRLLWKYYDYHDFGITGEPYFDIDFKEVLYLTDTGRRWDGEAVSVRDKAQGARRSTQGENPFADWKVKPFKYRNKPTPGPSQEGSPETGNTPSPRLRSAQPVPDSYRDSNSKRSEDPASAGQQPVTFPRFHSTSNIIKALNEGTFPAKAMMTFHPQRWTDKPIPWVKELVWQNVKNTVKYFVVRMGD